jgi:hypothetical protein
VPSGTPTARTVSSFSATTGDTALQ